MHLVELCPKECAALGGRFVRWRKEDSRRRKEALVREIYGIVRRLHRKGHYPSPNRVKALLKVTSLREWKTVTNAVKAARARIS
jgi:hypothetical protein